MRYAGGLSGFLSGCPFARFLLPAGVLKMALGGEPPQRVGEGMAASTVPPSSRKKPWQTLRIRLLSLRCDRLYMVFGAHEESLALGRDLAREKRSMVLFANADPTVAGQAAAFGAMACQSAPLLVGGGINERLMRLAGVTGAMRLRSVRLLILGGDWHFNIALAQAAIAYFDKCKIPAERAGIILRCDEGLDPCRLSQLGQAGGNRYETSVFSDAELTARLLVQGSPPVDTIAFDKNGVAQNDLHVLIAGFGSIGQNVLRHIIMKGQFHGSRFSAEVVDLSAEQIAVHFKARFPSLQDAYNITFHSLDVRTDEFCRRLDQWADTLRYIVVCLGTDEANHALAAILERCFSRMEEGKRPTIIVNTYSMHSIAAAGQENIRFFDKLRQVYCGKIFFREMDDCMAKAVNLSYAAHSGGPTDAQAAWRGADYFSRASSRASADFIPAMVKIAGLSMEQAADSAQFERTIAPGSDLEKSLGITEHLRWNAFHFANGYIKMPLSEVEARAAKRITPVQKDIFSCKHACLVSWDELERVSETVGSLTGNPGLAYQAMDIENVRRIPRTLMMKERIDCGAR